MDLIVGHVREHDATLVLVTHDEELAASCTDRIIRLADGRIVAGAVDRE
jgi:predicted ABC-type transport system involved in lysophospholipase L1 biosynthesis ATPase subunit